MSREKCHYRHLTNYQLVDRQKSLSLALDQAIDRGDKKEERSARARLWRVMDEQDKRRAEIFPGTRDALDKIKIRDKQ